MRLAYLSVALLVALGSVGCPELRPNKAWRACKKDPCSAKCSADLRATYCESYKDDPKCSACWRLESDGGPVDAGDGEGDGATSTCKGNLECTVLAPLCTDGACGACVDDTACKGREIAPVCDLESGSCVACTEKDAGACSGTSTPLCKASGHECVECNEQVDCAGKPEASACVDHACVPCSDGNDSQCSDVTGKNVCAAGTCVECTGTKAAACGEFVCDSKAHTCKDGVRPGDADLCESCVSDAHCGKTAPSLCMPTTFDGQDTGYFCLPTRDAETGPPGSCINDHRPYASTVNGGVGDPVPSIDGAVEPTCTLRVTSCQALSDFSNTSCTNEEDDDACGVPSLADGICAPVPSETIFRCSIPCGSDDDCNPGFACNGSHYCSL